ncbi:hypothetical protein [Candidatus Nitrosotenuis cloacae]|uniref:hypothetical protein n=1 Tax=Candidatus Nitrosotenuis cloacae TaxID=1603555 RepID=UPI0022825DF0|nr:hypothetical protein [Candidatus Nitrosotenuis cloacae]
MKTTLILTSIVAAIAISSIALVVSISQTKEITAAETPQGNDMYVFGESLYPVATFKFRDATVTYQFQTLTQISGFGAGNRGSIPEFTMQRIPGDTPYLHQALDQSHVNGGKSSLDFPYKEFDVTINMVQQGKTILTLDYQRCGISNHKIVTEFDKAESFTGKDGFAVLEQYTFTCGGYRINSPAYDELTQPVRPY